MTKRTTDEVIEDLEEQMKPDITLDDDDFLFAMFAPQPRELLDAYDHAKKVKRVADQFNVTDATHAEVIWKLQRD